MVLDVGFRSILALEEFAPSQDYTAHQLFRTRKGPNLMTRFEQKASSNVRKVSMHPFAIYIQISSAAVTDPSATNGRMSCSLASSHPLQGPFHARENKQIQAANTANMTISNTCANCKVEHHSLPCAISGIPNFGPCTCSIC